MKFIKEFKSFELNEGLFDKVKGWFKGDEPNNDDDFKPFEITVDDIKRNEFERKKKQQEEF